MLKILIVECDKVTRQSILDVIPWSEMKCVIIGCVASGSEALKICAHQNPNIIIANIIIPNIDWLSVIKTIKKEYPETQFVFLCNKGDENKVINLGAASILTKPINYALFEEKIFSFVNQIEKISQKQYDAPIQEQMLKNIINGYIYRKSALTPYIQQILCEPNGYRVVAFCFDNKHSVNHFMTRDLMKLCNILVDDGNAHFVCIDDTHLVLIVAANNSEDLNELSNYLSQIRTRLYIMSGSSISIGVSLIWHGHENLKDAYNQSLRANDRIFFTGTNKINYYFMNSNSQYNIERIDYNAILSFSDKIIDLIDRENVFSLVQSSEILFDKLISCFNEQVDLIKSTFIVIISITIKIIFGNDNRQLAVFLTKYSNLHKTISIVSNKELKEFFVDIVQELSLYRSTKNNTTDVLVNNAVQYIVENYCQNITLNDVAKKVYLSPSYLSTLITSETGKSFIDILNETRINNAKELLKDPNRKISEIAYSVGFREPQYFTVTFKKYTEMPPRDYREIYLKQIE